MIIELYGLPGSGKTTFAKHIKISSEWVNVTLSGKLEIVSNFFIGFILHPIVFTKGFIYWGTRNRSIFYLWNFYFVRYAKYQKACFLNISNKYVLLDEGPLQNIISYPEKKITDVELQKSLYLLPKVNKVIIFAVDEIQRKKQLSGRSYHQSWRKKNENDNDWDLIMIQNDILFKKHVMRDELYITWLGDVSPETFLNNCIT